MWPKKRSPPSANASLGGVDDSGAGRRRRMMLQERPGKNRGVLQVPSLEFQQKRSAKNDLEREIPKLGRHARSRARRSALNPVPRNISTDYHRVKGGPRRSSDSRGQMFLWPPPVIAPSMGCTHGVDRPF